MSNVRAEWYHERVGKGYLVAVWEARDGAEDQYDIELAYGGRYICTLSANCYGTGSAKYWYQYWAKVMKRYMHLVDQIDMANYNLLAYSKNLLLDGPKPEYEEQWTETKQELDMLSEWLKEMTDGFGDRIKMDIINEFNMYYG